MHKSTILIAEDEKYTRNTLAFVLEIAGYQVVETANGQEALQVILDQHSSASSIDLMLLDIEMSGLTGIQLLEELQRLHTSIPTIIITGLTDEQMLQTIQENGCLECLRKPFTPDNLIASIAQILDKRDQRGVR